MMSDYKAQHMQIPVHPFSLKSRLVLYLRIQQQQSCTMIAPINKLEHSKFDISIP